MYDYITCEMPLPAQPRPAGSREFQTKSFDCLLQRYTITAGGRLIQHAVRYEDVPENERPYPEFPFIGCMRAVPTGDVDTQFHGLFEFHGYDGETHWRYEAKFTDGRCMEIACVGYKRGWA